MKNVEKKFNTADCKSEHHEKLHIIEETLLENVSGAYGDAVICMCWQFCEMDPPKIVDAQ